MTKKMVIIIFMAMFLFQGFMLNAEVEVPKNILKKMKKGDKYLEKGKKAEKPEKKESYFKDALEQYNEVIKIDEKYAPAYFQLATISYIKKDIAKTEKLLQKTIALDPAHEKAQSTLAQLYLKQATAFQKQKDFEKMLKYQENFVNMPFAKKNMADKYSITLYLMGYYNSLFKKYKKGNEYLIKHVDLFTDKEKSKTYHFAAYMVGINCYALMEKEINDKESKKDVAKAKEVALKYEKIEKYLEQTIKAPQEKWTEDANLRLGTYYIYKGDKHKAKATIEHIIKTYPNSKDIEVYKNLLKNTIEKLK